MLALLAGRAADAARPVGYPVNTRWPRTERQHRTTSEHGVEPRQIGISSLTARKGGELRSLRLEDGVR